MTSPTYYSGVWASLLLGITGIVAPGLASSQDELEAETISIAAYEFPPYFSSNLEEHVVGALVQALNQRQQSYYFTITEVRPTQRHLALTAEGCCDLILFEDPQWGWQDSPREVVIGPVLTTGADLYLAADDPLEVLQNNATVGGVQGYHYKLTGYQQDTDVLEHDHSLYLADNQLTLLNMLRRERLDVVIISQELIRFLQVENEPLVADFEYQTAVDQQYQTRIIGRQDRAALIEWLELQLVAMSEEGELEQLFQRFGLQENLRFAPTNANVSAAEPAL